MQKWTELQTGMNKELNKKVGLMVLKGVSVYQMRTEKSLPAV